MNAPIAFDPTAPIPPGTTVLEASAGTGKTFAIVGLAARAIAEGTPISELLLVTFSRSATAELRERMRERVHGLVVALADPHTAADSTDALTARLAAGPPAEIARRRENLTRALSDFDASTIATTHTFCNRMLEALGFLGERETVQQIIENADDLVEQAARDLYLAGYRGTDTPQMTFAAAVTIAKDAVRHQGLQLAPNASELTEPAPADAVTAARHRVRFATRIREIVAERKLAARIRTYDDMQMILYRIVTDDVVGEDACARIRRVFALVLIDEFQDTDPFQWAIVRRCFHGHRTLVLVGDPKQSIYGFRGAEVLSYLQAVRSADSMFALTENWRSEGDLVEGLAAIYSGAALGEPAIVVHPVSSAHPGSTLSAPSGVAPVRMRAFTRSAFSSRGPSGFASVGDVRDAVIDDVAADVAGLLGSSTTLRVAGEQREVQPGDIAILVKFNKTIAPLQEALARVGVASVIGTGTSVFHTAAAHSWVAVIRAVEQPARADRVRLAALTPLVGWTAERLDREGDRGIAGLATYLTELGRVFDEGGFAAMAQRLMSRHDVAARTLATEHGERALTDLIQVASLCNTHVMTSGVGLTGVAEWLADRIADTAAWQRAEDQTRRLDRDTQVVQIMTVHASKGLQFPIVYVPFGWDAAGSSNQRETFTYHDAEGRRHLDVGGANAPGARERNARSEEEVAGEDLRLLYVALTRARTQVVLWWAPSYNCRLSALHRLLFGRAPGAATVPPAVDVPSDDECLDVLRSVADRSDFITLEKAGTATDRRWSGNPDDVGSAVLAASRFDRVIDQGWRRTSYSAIVAGAGHATISVDPPAATRVIDSGSEPDGDVLDDEPVDTDDDLIGGPLSGADSDGNRGGTPSLMNGLPFGAAFGTLVHEVLENVDTDALDITDHVAHLCREALRYRQIDVDLDTLTRALVGVLTTPLSFGNLWSVPTRHRLAEMEFEFPLAAEGSAATPSSMADLIAAHLDATDPLRGYPERLRDLPYRSLRGFLTGSIDSVLRTDDDRFVVVDYKTNRLRPGELVAEDFTIDAMADEMIEAHYPLQALIYSVALHRYLRWRMPDYQPGRHLGPVQYQFVRGMVGPHTPPGCGVVEWDVPSDLIVALSDLLAGDAPGDVR